MSQAFRPPQQGPSLIPQVSIPAQQQPLPTQQGLLKKTFPQEKKALDLYSIMYNSFEKAFRIVPQTGNTTDDSLHQFILNLELFGQSCDMLYSVLDYNKELVQAQYSPSRTVNPNVAQMQISLIEEIKQDFSEL